MVKGTRTLARNVLLLAAGALGLSLAAAALDRISEERGNRLYRRGATAQAIEQYLRHADRVEADAQLGYNLGTAWLTGGSASEAEAFLTAGRASGDPELRHRAAYNFGYLQLTQGMTLSDPVMATQLVGEAVLAFQSALRADPASQDARWNLGVALWKLDSLSAAAPGTRRGIPTRADAQGLDERDDAQNVVLGESGESTLESGADPAAREAALQQGGGVQETLAAAGDAGIRTPFEIERVLAAVDDDVSALFRRILYFLGPRDPLGERSARTGEW